MLSIQLPTDIEQHIQHVAQANGYAREILLKFFSKDKENSDTPISSWNREFGETTISAMNEARERKGKQYKTIDEAMTALLMNIREPKVLTRQ